MGYDPNPNPTWYLTQIKLKLVIKFVKFKSMLWVKSYILVVKVNLMVWPFNPIYPGGGGHMPPSLVKIAPEQKIGTFLALFFGTFL